MFQRSRAAADIAIDLGTARTVAVRPDGKPVGFPSWVAWTTGERAPRVGDEAAKLAGRGGRQTRVIAPIVAGRVADAQGASALVRAAIRECGLASGSGPSALLLVPANADTADRKALGDAAVAGGCRSVTLLPRALATGLGAALHVDACEGHLVVDVGAGHTEAAVFSAGGLVCASRVDVGSAQLDEALVDWLRVQHGLLISLATAAGIKGRIGVARARPPHARLVVRGRDQLVGEVRELHLSDAEVAEAYAPVLARILACATHVISLVPPELCADLTSTGLTLTGGGAQLRRLDEAFAEACGLAARVAADPAQSAMRGAALLLSQPERVARGQVSP